MPEIITFGETMAVMAPLGNGRIGDITDFTLRIAGAESNTAVGVSRLGHTAGWISALGNDAAGSYVRTEIEKENVDISNVKIDARHRTGLMLKEFIGGATNVYYYRENSAASKYVPEDIPFDYLDDAKIIHLTGITPLLSESCSRTVDELIKYGKKNGKLISFDPNIRLMLWKGLDYTEMINTLIFSSDIVLLGLGEAKLLFKTDDVDAIIRILRNGGVKYIAIKDGDKGAYCADEGDIVFIPPYSCNSVDPVGAGDGFNAGFLSGIIENEGLEQCGRMGGIVGAMATETAGDVDGYPYREELDRKLLKR